MTGLMRYLVECRAELDGDKLIGHGAVFNQRAKVPGGYEQLGTAAFDDVLARSDTDAVSLTNHDPHYLLGRQSAGTLRLRTDGDGLVFEVDLPDTSYANDLRKLVARGDMKGASFGFIPNLDKSTWTRAEDGAAVHTINVVSHLRDIGPVTFPAYSGTGVALRSYDLAPASSRDQLIRARARVHLKGARQ
jgi:HK97 family phage prohead protease